MRWSSLIVLLAATAAVAVAANAGTELVPAVVEDSPLPSSSSVVLLDEAEKEGRRLSGDDEKLWKELVPEGSDQDTDDNIECGEGLDELTEGETLRAVYLLSQKVLIETKTTGEATRVTEKAKNAKAEWVMNKLPKTLLRLLVPLADLLASQRLTSAERKEAVELALADKSPTLAKKDYDVKNKATTSVIYGQLINTIFRLYKREMDHDLSQERLANLKQEKSRSRKNQEKEAYKAWGERNTAEQKAKKEYNQVKEKFEAAKLVRDNAKGSGVSKAQKALDKATQAWNAVKDHKPPAALEPFEIPQHTTEGHDTIKANVEYVAQQFDQLFAGVTKTPFELPSIEKEPAQPLFKSLTAYTPKSPSKHAVNCKSLEMVIEDASNRLDENDDKMNKFVEIAKTALKVTNFVVTAVVKAGASASPAGPAGGALAGAAAGAVMDVIENVGSKVLDQDAAVRTLRRSVRRAMLATFKGYVGAHVTRHQIRVRKQLLTKVLKEAIDKAEQSKTKINAHELKRELRDQIRDVDIEDPDCTSALRNVVRDILTMLHPGSDLKIVQLIEQCASKSKEEAKEFLNPSTFSRLLPALQVISDKAGFDMSAIKPIEPVNPTEVVNDFVSGSGKEVFEAGMDYYKDLLDDKEAEEDKEKQLDALNDINSSIKDLGSPTPPTTK